MIRAAKHRRDVAAVVSTVGIAVAVLFGSEPDAGADTILRLPDGKAHGDGVTILKTRERVRVGPSMAANGAGRSAWISGNVKVLAPGIDTRRAGPFNFPRGEDAMPGSNGNSSTGAAASLSIGYVVGCQVEMGSMRAGLGGSISGTTILDTFGGSFSLPLAPGRVIYAQIERKQLTKPGTYYFNWRNSQMDIHGCGGYAQARSRVTLEVTGSDHQKITMWGRPFSIG